MKPLPVARPTMARRTTAIGGPLVWVFDGTLARSVADLEDALRRAIVQVGDVSSIAVQIDVSLPALKRRVDAGESLQPGWSQCLARLSDRYGLQKAPRVRHGRGPGPLLTLVIVYGS